MAVIGIQYSKDCQDVKICGLDVCDKPKELYIPLCGAHRALASANKIRVFTGKEIADYRI